MNKWQYIAIAITIAFFFIMYFGCETKPQTIKELEKSRSLTIESTGIQNLLIDAKKKLTPEQIILIETLDGIYSKDTSNVDGLKNLASKWYELGFPSISGHYAEQIALKQKDIQSWSMAGTTYSLCIKNSQSDKEKEFCTNRALRSYENALSLNPDDVDIKINMALCYIDNPPKDNPMKGILSLRELNTQYPENINVINQLARLAIKTNQLDRALERLNQSLALDANNKNTNCLLAQVYELKNDVANAEKFNKICNK
jgi:tetratricopeptide (TPR) repeat protein